MQISCPYSHAFNGCKVRIDDEQELRPCFIEFADGVVVSATAKADGDDILLDVPDYRTAKRSDVVARAWRLRRGDDALWRMEGRSG